MEKNVALQQIVQLLTLTAAYTQAGDTDRVMAALSIIADVMEENEVAPSDIEVFLTVVQEAAPDTAESQNNLRSRIESMVKEAQNVDDDEDEDESEGV